MIILFDLILMISYCTVIIMNEVSKFHKYLKMVDTMNFVRTKCRESISGALCQSRYPDGHNEVSAHLFSHRS